MGGGAQELGDTTYTKVFVGGLAWETQKDTLKKYFEQFGDILEAVVISDKATGRSKGYGFVTFRDADAAMRACVDAAPVIDGRRANCNLASLGLQRSKPSTPKNHQHAGGSRKMRGAVSSFQAASFGGTLFPSSFPPYAIPFSLFGYGPYSPDYTYPTSYYNVYAGGASGQYPMYGGGASGLMTGAAAFYPYLQFGEGGGGAAAGYASAQSYGVHYPHHLLHYSSTPASYPNQYGAPMSFSPSPALQSGVTVALQAPPIPHR